MDSLVTKRTVKEIRNDLKEFPRRESAISEIYKKTFSRIDTLENREIGEKVIMWISHVQRPLKLKDLQCVLTIRERDSDLDLDDLVPEELLISACADLVRVEDTSGEIQFVHSTAQEYVDSIKSSRYPDANAQIAKSCVQYLSLSNFCRETKSIHGTAFSRTVSKYPFLEYAALHWGLHARLTDSASFKSTLERLVMQFFDLKLQSTFAIRTLLCGVAGNDGAEMGDNLAKIDRSIKLINILAYFGLNYLVSALLCSRPDVIIESFDDFVGNVLHWAALGQQYTTLKLLLSQPSVSNIINQKGYALSTPLHLALKYRRDLAAEVLMHYGSDVTASAHWDTPLLVPSLHENSGIIPKLLLAANETQTLSRKGHGRTTPSRAAAMWEYKHVIVQPLTTLDKYDVNRYSGMLRNDHDRKSFPLTAQEGSPSTCQVLSQSKDSSELAIGTHTCGIIPRVLTIVNGDTEVTGAFLSLEDTAPLAIKSGAVVSTPAIAARFGQPLISDVMLARHPEACASGLHDYTILHHLRCSNSVDTLKDIPGHSLKLSALEATHISGDTPPI